MRKAIYPAPLAALLVLTGCGVDPDQGTRVLEAHGLTEVEIGRYAIFGCSVDDDFASIFTATDVNGKPVSGVLCDGLLKSMTVRFD